MLTLKLVGAAIAPAVIFGTLLLIPAGTLNWWRAWAFIVVVLACNAVTIFGIFSSNEELLNERYKPGIQKGQPLADKVVLNVFVICFFLVIAMIPIDVFRLHLMAAPAPIVSLFGLLLFIAGWLLIAMAFRENSFAAPVVKLQEERNQKVIDSGVYRAIRHPMYASCPLLLIGMTLWLQSTAATLLAVVPIAAIMLRIVFEERFLATRLPGYGDYMRRVRYRMIPFVW